MELACARNVVIIPFGGTNANSMHNNTKFFFQTIAMLNICVSDFRSHIHQNFNTYQKTNNYLLGIFEIEQRSSSKIALIN